MYHCLKVLLDCIGLLFWFYEGIYGATPGPTYETHQEVQSYYRLGIFHSYKGIHSLPGASAFGMSTVPETMAARAIGIEVYAMSLITNLAAGLTDEKLTHLGVMISLNWKLINLGHFSGSRECPSIHKVHEEVFGSNQSGKSRSSSVSNF